MNIKRQFQSIFNKKKPKGRKVSASKAKEISSKMSGRKASGGGRNPFFRFLVLLCLTFFVLFTIYRGVLVALYNQSKFANIDFKSAFETASVEEWNKRDKISILIIGENLQQSRYRQIDTLILLQLNPRSKELVWMFFPTDSYVNTDSGLTSIKNLIVEGDLKNPGKGYEYAVDQIEAATYIKYDRYFIFDTVVLPKLLTVLGDLEVRIPTELSLEDQTTKFKVAAFDENRITLNADSVLSFVNDNSGGEADKLSRQELLFKGLVNSPDFFDIWALDRVTVLLEKYAYSNFSSNEFLDVWTYIRKSDNEYASNILNPLELEESINTDGGSVRVFGGATVWTFIRENSLNQDVRDELARVEVFNGSDTAGAASKYTNYFRNEGIDVIRKNNAPNFYDKSVVYVQDSSRGYDETVRVIKKYFDADIEIVEGQTEFLSTGDIVVILGKDIEK